MDIRKWEVFINLYAESGFKRERFQAWSIFVNATFYEFKSPSTYFHIEQRLENY